VLQRHTQVDQLMVEDHRQLALLSHSLESPFPLPNRLGAPVAFRNLEMLRSGSSEYKSRTDRVGSLATGRLVATVAA